MSNHSIIEHRANYHYIKIEEDYVRICSFGKQYPQCKAAILGVLEHWINDKQSKGQSLYVYMTYPEWIEAMYGLFRRNTIIACLAELVQEKLVFHRPCIRYGKKTFEYSLNIKLVQERLKELAERDEKNCHPNLNAFKFKREEKTTPSHPNLNGISHPNLNGMPSKFKRNIDTTEIPSDIDSEGTYGANAPTLALLSSEELHEKVDGAIIGTETVLRHITGEHPAIHTNETPYHIANPAIGNEEDEFVLSAPRLTLQSKIGATHGADTDTGSDLLYSRGGGPARHSDSDIPIGVDSLSTQRITSQQAPGTAALPPAADPPVGRSSGISSVQAISAPLVPLPAQPSSPPVRSASAPDTAQASGHIPKRPTLKSDPREVQARIDAHRGYALEEKVEVIRERQAIKTWCSLHEIGECDLVLNYLTTVDKYWKLEENKHRIGGVTLAKETPKALAALERKGQPAQADWIPADNDYSLKAELRRDELRAGGAK